MDWKNIMPAEGRISEWSIAPATECLVEMFSMSHDVLAQADNNISYNELAEFKDCYCITGCLLPKHQRRDIVVPNIIDGKRIVGISNDVFHYVKYESAYDAIEYKSVNNEDLQYVKISDGIVYIGDNAFHSCVQLYSVGFPKTLRRIGRAAFANCVSLRCTSFGDGVISIGEWAFSNCTSLTEIILPLSLLAVQNCTFAYCKSLHTVAFSNSIKEIGIAAFADTSLDCAILEEGVIVLQDDAFGNIGTLRGIVLPKSLRKIEQIIRNNQSPTFFVYPGSYGLMWAREHGYKVASAEI